MRRASYSSSLELRLILAPISINKKRKRRADETDFRKAAKKSKVLYSSSSFQRRRSERISRTSQAESEAKTGKEFVNQEKKESGTVARKYSNVKADSLNNNPHILQPKFEADAAVNNHSNKNPESSGNIHSQAYHIEDDEISKPNVEFVSEEEVRSYLSPSVSSQPYEDETGLSARSLHKKGLNCDSLDDEFMSKLRSKYYLDMNSFLKSQDWNMKAPPLFGIDFGTSNTVVSFVEVSSPQLIQVWKTDSGEELRPCTVGFKSGELLFSNHALSEMKTSPENVVTNVKGLLGRKFDHEHVKILEKRKAYGLYEEEDTEMFSLSSVLPLTF